MSLSGLKSAGTQAFSLRHGARRSQLSRAKPEHKLPDARQGSGRSRDRLNHACHHFQWCRVDARRTQTPIDSQEHDHNLLTTLSNFTQRPE
jgi:hypothetical protein